jgi:hypothetical protein
MFELNAAAEAVMAEPRPRVSRFFSHSFQWSPIASPNFESTALRAPRERLPS